MRGRLGASIRAAKGTLPMPAAAKRWLLDLAALLSVAVVIALRDPLPLLRAEFWAEDATELFFGAHSLGIRSLLAPVYGQQFFLSRLVAWAATPFHVLYTPYVYAWASLALNALSVSYIARDGFAWLVPERARRVALALLLAVGPGTSDVFLNLVSLPYSLGFLTLLVLVEEPLRMSWRRLAVFLLLVLSSAQAVLWLPIAAYQWWRSRDRGTAAAALATAALAALNLAGAHQASSEVRLAAYDLASLLPRILVENLFTSMVVGPLLGAGLTGWLMRAPPAAFWASATAGLAAALVLARRAWRAHRDAIAILGLAALGAVGSLGVVALSRRYAIHQLLRESGAAKWVLRYYLLPSSVALTAWFAVLLRVRGRSRVWGVLGAIGLVCLSVQAAVWWPKVHPRPDLHWDVRSARVQEILDRKDGQPRVMALRDLAVHPVGWLPNNGRTAVVLPPR